FEVELAACEPERAREVRARAEERRDENGRVPDASSRASGGRVEGSVRDGSPQVAPELAVDAGVQEMAVLALRLTGTRALSRERHERSVVGPADAEGAFVVLLDGPGPRARVRRPGIAAGAVIGHDDGRRKAVLTVLLALPFST